MKNTPKPDAAKKKLLQSLKLRRASAEKNIWQAQLVGWPKLAQSWQETLTAIDNQLQPLLDNEARTNRPNA